MTDRIAERRRRTIDEIVTVAVEVMSESGAAGLSLGEVAKRMGMRTPSLYGYFDSKAALCDELFRRGWADLTATMRPEYERRPATSSSALHRQMTSTLRVFVGWALDHRATAELMFWRPVAGWEPSPGAYAPAVELMAALSASVAAMQEAGALRAEVKIDELVDVLVIQSAGVITQQLANEPGASVRSGRFAKRIGALVATFLAEYGALEGGDR